MLGLDHVNLAARVTWHRAVVNLGEVRHWVCISIKAHVEEKYARLNIKKFWIGPLTRTKQDSFVLAPIPAQTVPTMCSLMRNASFQRCWYSGPLKRTQRKQGVVFVPLLEIRTCQLCVPTSNNWSLNRVCPSFIPKILEHVSGHPGG